MKCIKCAQDSKKKDRPHGSCPNCSERFAFDPTQGDPLTDAAYAACIARVSGDGQVKYSLRHLYFEVRRTQLVQQRRVRTREAVLALMAVGLLLFYVVVTSFLPATALWRALLLMPFVIAVLLAFAHRAIFSSRSSTISLVDFHHLHRDWTAAHGRLLALASPARPNPTRRVETTELLAYSFDRAVITDRDDIVDVLVANRFHFENNCAVLSINGHPAAAFDTVRTMLRNNPRIEVFALHDASIEGCELAERLRNDPAWFMDIGKVIDVGLRPAHAKFFPDAVDEHAAVRVPPHPARTPEEDAWLATHTLELAAIRPEQLIKRLYRAMTRQPETAGVTLLGTDAGASDGGADSFG